jgi:hypothetical protein
MSCQGLVVSVLERPKIQEELQIKNHYTTLNLSHTTDSLSECQIGRWMGSISNSPIQNFMLNMKKNMKTKKFPSVFCVYSPTQGEARQLCMSPFYLSPSTSKLLLNYTDDLP